MITKLTSLSKLGLRIGETKPVLGLNKGRGMSKWQGMGLLTDSYYIKGFDKN